MAVAGVHIEMFARCADMKKINLLATKKRAFKSLSTYIFAQIIFYISFQASFMARNVAAVVSAILHVHSDYLRFVVSALIFCRFPFKYTQRRDRHQCAAKLAPFIARLMKY